MASRASGSSSIGRRPRPSRASQASRQDYGPHPRTSTVSRRLSRTRTAPSRWPPSAGSRCFQWSCTHLHGTRPAEPPHLRPASVVIRPAREQPIMGPAWYAHRVAAHVITFLRWVLTVMSRNGDKRKPLPVGEFGWPSSVREPVSSTSGIETTGAGQARRISPGAATARSASKGAEAAEHLLLHVDQQPGAGRSVVQLVGAAWTPRLPGDHEARARCVPKGRAED